MSTDRPAVVQAILDEYGDSADIMFDSFPSGQQLALLDDSGHQITQRTLTELRQGPGRRLGARNKRSLQIGKLIGQKYGNAVLSAANAAFMPTDVLTKVLRAMDRDDNFDEKLERLERLVERIGDKLTKEMATRLTMRLMKMMSRPTISAFDVWKEQNTTKKWIAEYQDQKLPVQVSHTGRPDVILNIPGLTDPSHLAEIIGQHELSDDDINQIAVVGTNDSDFEDFAFVDDDEEDWIQGD